MSNDQLRWAKASLVTFTCRLVAAFLFLWCATTGATSALAFPVDDSGSAANYVIGQDDFVSGHAPFSEGEQFGALYASSSTFYVPYDVVFDQASKQLFVADLSNTRILVFDLSDGIGPALEANLVLGQPDFETGYSSTTSDSWDTPNPTFGCAVGNNACGMSRVYAVAFDPVNQRLFAADIDNDRVLVWDLSAGRANGMAASWVLGQHDFVTTATNTSCDGASAGAVSACGLRRPVALLYDVPSEQLFVADSENNRVVVYDLSGGLVSGMGASTVLGQPVLTSGSPHLACDGVTPSTVDACGLELPYGLTMDSSGQRLFVSDHGARRVVSYSIGSGITSGMAADAVLGQPDFVTSTTNTSCDGTTNGIESANQCGLGEWPVHLEYDSNHDRLFASDEANHRILVFETSSITNGEAAASIIGRSTFTGGYQPALDGWGGETSRSGLVAAGGLAYDTELDRLFVADEGNHRIMVFGANVDGTPVNASGAVQSMSTTSDATSTTVEFTTEIGDAYTVAFPSGTQALPGSEEISLWASNPDETGWNLPTIEIDAELPQGMTKTITIATGQFASVCILDHEDFEFLSGSYCNFDGHPHSYALPSPGDCRLELTHGDLGDNPSDPLDPEGLHEIEICLAADLSSITASGLMHTGMQLGRGVSPNIGTTDESALEQENQQSTAGCNTGGRRSGMAALVLVALCLLGLRRGKLSATVLRVGVFLMLGFCATSAQAFPVNDSGSAANYVIGQDDFDTGGSFALPWLGAPFASDSTFFGPRDLVYDAADKRLFVVDLHNARVLLFDLNGPLDNQQAASFVLGQPDFVTGYDNPDFVWESQWNTPNPVFGCAVGVNPCGMARPWAIDYDAEHQLLFVADAENNRIAIYDLSAGITNGMPMSYVLGQQDFSSREADAACDGLSAGLTNACGLNFPTDISYDPVAERLYVADEENHRVVRFDLSSGITSGMAAEAVIGQTSFTTQTQSLACNGVSTGIDSCALKNPKQLVLDTTGRRLFVWEWGAKRILAFDIDSGFTHGTPSSLVIGQPDFTTAGFNTSCDGTSNGSEATNECGLGIWPVSLEYDATHDRLFASDASNQRVLVFDVSIAPVVGAATAVLGRTNFTDGYVAASPEWGGSVSRSTLHGGSGLAYDGVEDRLFVADVGNHRIMVFGANVDGTPVNASGAVQSMSTTSDATSTTVEFTTEIGDAYTVAFPNGTLALPGSEEISLWASNPDETGWNLPTIEIDAELPQGMTKTITIATGQFASVCILDHQDFEFLSGSYCNFDGHPHSYALPPPGDCRLELTHGDLGDNPSDPLDPEGLHEIEICLAADLSSITASGLMHTGMQLGRGISPNIGTTDESALEQENQQSSAGCNTSSSTSRHSIWLLLALVMLFERRRLKRRAVSRN